ncbi:MAG TPA: A24 family peptidase [Dehalococcoidia bacterium]|nr:A24 family peptidase [Dehalococcoidia bacterium]
MTPLLFFLAGIPAALVLNHGIAVLGREQDPAEDGLEANEPGPGPVVRKLPWQVQPWRDRVRVLVVAAAPFLMAGAGWRFEPLEAVAVSALILALLLCTGTDLIEYRVPNVVTYPGIVLALAAAALFPDGDPVNALVAGVVGGLIFLVLAIVTRGGLGLGDVKLAVLIGVALGFPASYQALVIGVLTGGVVILALFLAGIVSRKQAVPYAPFLALAAVGIVLTQGAVFAPL